MTSQKHLFQLPEDIHYLNGAYMSPLLKSVEETGIAAIARKRNPFTIKPADFFHEPEQVKKNFGRLINGKPEQVAIIPSASYGLKSATINIPAQRGTHAITVADEFPSGFYSISEWCQANKKELKIIKPPNSLEKRGKQWNENLLNEINTETAAVLISSIHWTDGTLFDLRKIGERCREVNALFIVDGTQSVGALPIDVTAYKIDALICAAYKWLLGPYSIGLAYYGDAFESGKPIEDSWLNRLNAEDFTKLTSYEDSYRAGAARFSMGENSNFILLPMLHKALDQIQEWGVPSIQDYSTELIQPLSLFLRDKNFWMEEPAFRADHLFGFLLPRHIDKHILLQQLHDSNLIVSLRGDAIRVSTHIYNTRNDIDRLMEVLQNQ